MGLLHAEDWNGAQWIGLDEADDQGIEITDLKAAHWLWYPEGNAAHDAPTETRYFRRTMDVPADRKISRAICFFAGDDQCVFYVNGAQIGVGHGHPGLVGADVTGQLRPGANELAVAATNMPSNVPNNPGGWIGALRVEFEQGPPLVIHSDGNWKCAKTATEGWQTAEFDDASWMAAQELGQAGIAPWGIPWKDRWYTEHRRLAARYLRREFDVDQGKTIRRATVYVCGLGFFDLHVNGQLIGDQLMNPALTGYDKRVLYDTFDVTAAVEVRPKCPRRRSEQRAVFCSPLSEPHADADLRLSEDAAANAGRIRRRHAADHRQRRRLETDGERARTRQQRV